MYKRAHSLSRKHAVALVGLNCIAAFTGVAANGAYPPYNNDDIIKRDICVIGGGAAGTYAGIRLW
jgi:hypothetical protein